MTPSVKFFNRAVVTNQQIKHRSPSPSQSGSERETETSDAPGCVGELCDALNALRKYDDGRNFPVPPHWEEESRRFGGAAQQTRTSGQPAPVFSEGLAPTAERSLLRARWTRHFSRRVHRDTRGRLLTHES